MASHVEETSEWAAASSPSGALQVRAGVRDSGGRGDSLSHTEPGDILLAATLSGDRPSGTIVSDVRRFFAGDGEIESSLSSSLSASLADVM